MEVLERSLKVERGLCLRMKEEEGKFCDIGCVEVGHGRATYWHGPCQGSGVLLSFML